MTGLSEVLLEHKLMHERIPVELQKKFAETYGLNMVGLAQLAEYGGKSLLRRLAPGPRNKALADHFATKARLQFANNLQPFLRLKSRCGCTCTPNPPSLETVQSH